MMLIAIIEGIKKIGPTIVSLALLAICVGTWLTPKKTENHNSYYTDKSQWQAMMMLPSEQWPFEIEVFQYSNSSDHGTSETAQAFITQLKARCVFWLTTNLPAREWDNRATHTVIQCFKKRTDLKKFKKEKELP